MTPALVDALAEPATREIEARELREGMYMQCGGKSDIHFHRVQQCLGVTNGCAAWIVAPAEHPCTRTTITLHQSRTITIRADAPAEPPEPMYTCICERCGEPSEGNCDCGFCSTCQDEACECKDEPAKPPHPTIHVRASDVVPGMLWCGEEPIERVERRDERVWLHLRGHRDPLDYGPDEIVDAHVDGQRAGRAEAFRDVAAYLLDRADQYELDSGCWVALADAAREIMNGRVDEVKAYGDLDEDLYRRVDGMSRPVAGGDDE